MCGMCCRAIVINKSFDAVKESFDVQNYLRTGRVYGKISDLVFIYLNWVPISRTDALSINPSLDEWFKKLNDLGNGSKINCYTCRKLNGDNRCEDHESRPQICSNFPWYGRDPDPNEQLYSKNCGYRVDQMGDAK